MNQYNSEKRISLPKGFNGVFTFTNYTDEEFKARWANVEYIFPPKKTTPLVIVTATPFEVQNIRKRFARELALREFYKTPKYNKLEATGGAVPAIYTEDDLVPFIQKCLEPLEAGEIEMEDVTQTHEHKFRKDNNGNPRSVVIEGTPTEAGVATGASLVGDGQIIRD